ncbi:UNKNOWN [Stylonychia lemnae]|uniref:Uncharacterized protein n=1 Tax=Stylonychia lemnae TaxID=5949 RepID=A0A078AXQ6_STYLE|nr:UNKNOWN [Stylonychia lemnae]|eukprot:CDW87240.1 UNKNOWN [Stylonychia lemnae]
MKRAEEAQTIKDGFENNFSNLEASTSAAHKDRADQLKKANVEFNVVRKSKIIMHCFLSLKGLKISNDNTQMFRYPSITLPMATSKLCQIQLDSKNLKSADFVTALKEYVSTLSLSKEQKV